jgi:cbb3-type cytochrome oxidase subunit 3
MTPINLARTIVTIGWFALFVAISVAAWRGWRRDDYAALARLPLEDCDGATDQPEPRP